MARRYLLPFALLALAMRVVGQKDPDPAATAAADNFKDPDPAATSGGGSCAFNQNNDCKTSSGDCTTSSGGSCAVNQNTCTRIAGGGHACTCDSTNNFVLDHDTCACTAGSSWDASSHSCTQNLYQGNEMSAADREELEKALQDVETGFMITENVIYYGIIAVVVLAPFGMLMYSKGQWDLQKDDPTGVGNLCCYTCRFWCPMFGEVKTFTEKEARDKRKEIEQRGRVVQQVHMVGAPGQTMMQQPMMVASNQAVMQQPNMMMMQQPDGTMQQVMVMQQPMTAQQMVAGAVVQQPMMQQPVMMQQQQQQQHIAPEQY